MEIGRTLLQYGDVSNGSGEAMVVLVAVVRVRDEHGVAICARGALHWGIGDASVDVGSIAEARGQDGEDEGGEVSCHRELMLGMNYRGAFIRLPSVCCGQR